MKLISKISILIILANFFGTFAIASGDPNNPWQSLSESTREGIRPFLFSPADPAKKIADDTGFQAWYQKLYSVPGSAKPEDVYPEYRYNALSLPERVASACVFSQVKKDFLDTLTHPVIGTASIVYGDQQGALIAYVSDPTALQADLKNAGFTGDYCAGPKDPQINIYCGEGGPPKVWGLRSNVHGQALHWYQTAQMVKDHQVSVHIDYYNPGAEAQFKALKPSQRVIDYDLENGVIDTLRAAMHVDHDLLKWGDRNMVKLIDSQPEQCGLGAKDINAAQIETKENPPESAWTKLLDRFYNPFTAACSPF